MKTCSWASFHEISCNSNLKSKLLDIKVWWLSIFHQKGKVCKFQFGLLALSDGTIYKCDQYLFHQRGKSLLDISVGFVGIMFMCSNSVLIRQSQPKYLMCYFFMGNCTCRYETYDAPYTETCICKVLHPKPNWACVLVCLKIINIFWEKMIIW